MQVYTHHLPVAKLLAREQNNLTTPQHLGLHAWGEWEAAQAPPPLLPPQATSVALLVDVFNAQQLAEMATLDPPINIPRRLLPKLEKETLALISALLASGAKLQLGHRFPTTPPALIQQLLTAAKPFTATQIEKNIVFQHIPYNDVWLRDTGSLFLHTSPQAGKRLGGALLFQFTAWGEKYPYTYDKQVNKHFLNSLLTTQYFHAAYDEFHVFVTDFSCEGGAVECNGADIAIVTRSVINQRTQIIHGKKKTLTQVENTHIFQQLLGVRHVIYLEGGLSHDDTDGHVDNVCRFIDKNTLLVAMPYQVATTTAPKNLPAEELEEAQRLARNKRILADFFAKTSVNQRNIKLIPLPLPPPTYTNRGYRRKVPQSYLNYLATPQGIFFPAYQRAYEEKVVKPLLRRIFPQTPLNGIHWQHHSLEGGGIHCRTLTLPC